MCLIASDICWDSKISHWHCPLTFTPGLTKNNSHLLHSDWHRWRTWLTQNMWVTDSRMLCSLPRSCLVHPADHFDSEGRFSSDQVKFLTVLRFFLVKNMQHLSEKTQFPGFLFLQVVPEALVRWGGEIKYVFIAYFLGNISAKNCCNRTVYVKIIASQRWDFFWDTVYMYKISLGTLQWENFENRSTYVEVMTQNQVPCFF